MYFHSYVMYAVYKKAWITKWFGTRKSYHNLFSLQKHKHMFRVWIFFPYTTMVVILWCNYLTIYKPGNTGKCFRNTEINYLFEKVHQKRHFQCLVLSCSTEEPNKFHPTEHLRMKMLSVHIRQNLHFLVTKINKIGKYTQTTLNFNWHLLQRCNLPQCFNF